MRLRPILVLLFSLSLLVLASTSGARADPPDGLDADVDAFVESYLDRHGLPGASVAVVKDGETVYEQGYGEDSEDEPLSPDSRMRLASVSKAFTAFAVLQLVDRGEVELDEPVVDHLPDFTAGDDPRAADITVRQLLSHTSGVPNPTIVPAAETVPEGAARTRQWPLSTDPGTSYRYSNLNYWVAAWLVQEVSGMPFEDFLERNVFEPLGMDDTRATTTAGTPIDGLARGHVTAYGTAFAAPEAEQMFAGAGGVSSSAADMARWLAMWQRDGVTEDGTALLSPDLVREAQTPSPMQVAQGSAGNTVRRGSPRSGCRRAAC
ncbi:MAG: serine hydrolase domain-containing protein [Propionibacteriaceae bacterium]